MGTALEAAAWLVAAVTLDGHHAHHYVKEALYGVFNKLAPEALQSVPFWRDVSWKDMPRHALPRLPVRLCMHSNEAIFCFGGPCNLVNF